MTFSSDVMYFFRIMVLKNINVSFAFFYMYSFFHEQNIENHYFSTLPSSGDVVYQERWWHWQVQVTDLFFSHFTCLF